jgi:hypothetical protein
MMHGACTHGVGMGSQRNLAVSKHTGHFPSIFFRDCFQSREAVADNSARNRSYDFETSVAFRTRRMS